jgi:4,5-DOPA dioxygenase extradiol
MHALDPGAVGAFWSALGRDWPRPKALVIASAHWETARPMLTGSATPETVHDFHGFPAPLYRIRYPAPGAPALASRAKSLLDAAGIGAAIDEGRGLDHGAWSPLLHLYPQADIPVVQLSLQTALGGRHHLAVGRALAPLADDGVLIVGSGHMTHNLRDWMANARAAVAPVEPYVTRFQTWVAERIAARDFDALVDYRARTADGVRAHPTDEHFQPLFVAMGAAGANAAAERLYDAVEGGVLAMDAWAFRQA